MADPGKAVSGMASAARGAARPDCAVATSPALHGPTVAAPRRAHISVAEAPRATAGVAAPTQWVTSLAEFTTVHVSIGFQLRQEPHHFCNILTKVVSEFLAVILWQSSTRLYLAVPPDDCTTNAAKPGYAKALPGDCRSAGKVVHCRRSQNPCRIFYRKPRSFIVRQSQEGQDLSIFCQWVLRQITKEQGEDPLGRNKRK